MPILVWNGRSEGYDAVDDFEDDAAPPVDADIVAGVLYEGPVALRSDVRVRVELIPGSEGIGRRFDFFEDLPVRFKPASSGKGSGRGYLAADWTQSARLTRGLLEGSGGSPQGKTILVHRLVAALARGHVGGLEVHHDNFNAFDNHADNLVPMTKAEHDELHRARPRPTIRLPGRRLPHLLLRVVALDQPEASHLPASTLARVDWTWPGEPPRHRARDPRTSPPRTGTVPGGRPPHTGWNTCSKGDGEPDGPFPDSGNESHLYAAPVWGARSLGRFGLRGDMAVRGALVLRLIREQGGPTRRRVIEAALLANGWSARTIGGTLAALISAGFIHRTRPGRYGLTLKAFA